MILTEEKLQACLPNNKYIGDWFQSMEKFFPLYEIDTLERISGFISQCSHESAEFTRLVENLNYRWESLRRVFPKYFRDDAIAKQYAHNQKAIANRVYANRMENGSEESGDGWKYRGRGILQITGKRNYRLFSEFCGLDLEEVPDFLETFSIQIGRAHV